jgi:mercuric ion binding protein
MLKHIALPLSFAGILLSGCGQAPEAGTTAVQEGVVRMVQEVVIQSGTPVTHADLTIEGMSCEMMCGGAIKKALAKLPGVTSTEIAFDDDDAPDHAIVTYDDSKVTDAELVKAIQSLYDGQYKVRAVNVIKEVKASGTSRTAEGADTKEAKDMKALLPTNAILPSIVGLLTRILRY